MKIIVFNSIFSLSLNNILLQYLFLKFQFRFIEDDISRLVLFYGNKYFLTISLSLFYFIEVNIFHKRMTPFVHTPSG